MALATMIAELNKARKDYNEKLAELGNSAGKAIAEFLAPNIPEGFCVQWKQYTPYFNDGEPCNFRVGDAHLVKLDPAKNREDISRCPDDSDEDFTYLDGYYAKIYGDEKHPEIEGAPKEKVVALCEAWKELPEDMLEAAFGDHVRVRVFADGTVATNHHDHN